MNVVSLTGRLTEKPELRMTQSEKSVCSFTLAVKDMDSTSFIRCVAWDKSAEYISRADKGDLVEVSGKIVTRSYEDKDGHKRTATEVSVRQLSAYKTSRREEVSDEDMPF